MKCILCYDRISIHDSRVSKKPLLLSTLLIVSLSTADCLMCLLTPLTIVSAFTRDWQFGITGNLYIYNISWTSLCMYIKRCSWSIDSFVLLSQGSRWDKPVNRSILLTSMALEGVHFEMIVIHWTVFEILVFDITLRNFDTQFWYFDTQLSKFWCNQFELLQDINYSLRQI